MGWLSGWDKRVKLTIDQNDIDAALSNFPILLYLSTVSGRKADDVSFIFDELQHLDANRFKIVVTTNDGTTQCYVEIEKWNSASASLVYLTMVSYIGRDAEIGYELYFDGIIDEARTSNVARNAEWIKASYESGRDDLLDWGTEEGGREL